MEQGPGARRGSSRKDCQPVSSSALVCQSWETAGKAKEPLDSFVELGSRLFWIYSYREAALGHLREGKEGMKRAESRDVK